MNCAELTKQKLLYNDMLSEYFAKYPDNDYLSYMNDNKADADLSSVINVLIPDYCDPDLINTVKSMFINAANPQRVRIKVFYQDDNDEMFEELSNMPNVKMKRISPDACRGSAYARYQCSTMVENDTDYVMHVDSHMRCAKFWDVAMITLWKNCNDENAIVSQRSPNFSECYDEPLDSDRWIKEVQHMFNKLRYAEYTDFYGNVLPIPLSVWPNDNSISRQTACISAHTLFIKASTDKIVPFDPYMYFYADENCMALRYWTHGYNIYSPDYYPIFHLYEREETMKKYLNIDLDRCNRVQDEWLRYTVEVERTKALFGLFDRKVDLGRFCLGNKRTLKEYEEYCGVDFKNKKISQYCLNGDVHIKTGETFDIPNPTEEKLNEDIDDVTYKYTREDLIEIWRDINVIKTDAISENRITVEYAVDDNNAALALVSMTSLLDNTEEKIDIFLLYSNLSEESVSLLDTIKKYKNCKLSYIKDNNESRREANTVLHLACDTLFLGDIKNLSSEEDDKEPVMVCFEGTEPYLCKCQNSYKRYWWHYARLSAAHIHFLELHFNDAEVLFKNVTCDLEYTIGGDK